MTETNVTKKDDAANQSSKESILALINATPASGLPAVPQIANRFKHLYATIHGRGRKVEAFYEAEKFHFMKMVNESKDLASCTKLSLYGCFLDVAVNGLSFDPSFKHLYLVGYNHNVGTRQNPKWEKRAQLQIGGPGELLLRIMQGQIKHADNPVVVYEDEADDFKYGTKDGKGFVEHVAKAVHKTNKVIACYMGITRNDGSVDYKVITQADMDRFRAFSKDKDSKAYVEGEGGMWQAKCIKHAFKNYPKVRTGTYSALQTNTVDEKAEIEASAMHMPAVIDYGMDESMIEHAGAGNGSDYAEFEDVPQPQQESKAQEQKDLPDDDSFVTGTKVEKTVQKGGDEFE